MAIIKCKMCGGDLRLLPESLIAECEYCGTTQTVPSADNEKKLALFNRANKLRISCEFDKASGIYESIVADFPEEAEAYWGIVLCKYGIEYVDDPVSGKKIPTCHRTRTMSIMDDSDFELVCENADIVAKRVYREEAKVIDGLQKKILSIVANEKPYDIFICYKENDDVTGARTEDSTIAQDIYTELVKDGYKVFFSRVTLRDHAGVEYEPYIYSALSSAKVMLALGTKHEYFDAVWVKNEWSRYIGMINTDSSKTLIACYKNLDAYDIPKEFANLQALNMGEVTFFRSLINNINELIPKSKDSPTPSLSKESTSSASSTKEIALDNGGLYTGEALAGKPHGKGTCIYENGDKYEGEWAFGKFHGIGKYCYKNGDRYEGSFAEGKRNGQGKLIRADSSEWIGEWKDDFCYEGNGTCQFENCLYTGPIFDGKRNGYGMILWREGGSWEGEFVNNNATNGSGKWIEDDGYYTGQIKDGRYVGQGEYRYSDGNYFVGEWIPPQTRIGTMHYNNGKTWTGEYQNGNPWNGEGRLYYWGDSILDGRYLDGYYEGSICDGKREGHGEYWYKHGIYIGSRYVGEWHLDKRHGKGVIYWANGETWTGTFKEGRKWNGNGATYDSDDVMVHYRIRDGSYDMSKCGCYIATCVYGSYDCPQVWTLRRYRDYILATTWYGRAFIRTYYMISPTIVKLFGKTNWFKIMWRSRLDKMVADLKATGVEDTPYIDKNWRNK